MRDDIIPREAVLQIIKDWYMASGACSPTEKGKYEIFFGTDGSVLVRFTPIAELIETEHG